MTSRADTGARRPTVAAQAGTSLLAAAVFAVRAVRTGLGDGLPDGQDSTPGLLLAVAATLVAVAAAALAWLSARAAVVPLVVLLAAEFLVLDDYVAPPRLLAALPLVFALALALVRPGAPERPTAAGTASGTQRVLTVLAFLLMAPVGFFYLSTGLVAPAPDVFGAYALFAVLVGVAVLLARRRSRWVIAVPVAAAGLWFAMLWLGEAVLGWSP